MPKAYFIFFASLLDALATDMGIRFHYVEESNPMMFTLYHSNILLFYLCKIILPVLLLLLYRTGQIKSVWMERFIVFVAFIYTLLLLYHMTWIAFVLIHG